MNARLLVLCFVMFAVAAALGAGFAVFGPVALIRLFGTVAFIAGAAGCAVQLYALRQFAPRAYALLHRRYAARVHQLPGTLTAAQRTVLAYPR